jgi:hypothetical protein
MTRDEAIRILVRNDIAALSPEARASLLLDWWTIEASDPDYAELPARSLPDDSRSLDIKPALSAPSKFSHTAHAAAIAV